MTLARKLAVIGGFVGVALAVALAIASATRRSPEEPGENVMWFYTYAALIGAPLSIVAAVLQTKVRSATVSALIVLAAIPANWAMIGFLLGWLIGLFGRRGPSP